MVSDCIGEELSAGRLVELGADEATSLKVLVDVCLIRAGNQCESPGSDLAKCILQTVDRGVLLNLSPTLL